MINARRLALAALLLAAPVALFVAAQGKPRDIPLEPQSVEISARPLPAFRASTPEARRFGALEWVGGLEFSSAFRGLGGLSGLAYTAPGGRRFVAVSDAGIWFEGEIVAEGEKPIALRGVRAAAMRGEGGENLAGTTRGDAEDVVVRGNEVIVSFERINEVRRYARSGDLLTARAEPLAVPAGIRRLRSSSGLEAIALFPAGTRHAGALLAVGERPIRGEAALPAWIVGGTSPGRFDIVQRDGYQATGVAVLPSGDVLLLERLYEPPFSLSCRIRRLPAAALTSGALVDGPVVFKAGLDSAIDNMEGIAVHRGADGATYVTLVSDDNFSFAQRTLLLRFRLVE